MDKHLVARLGIVLACVSVACGRSEDTATPVATPAVTLSRVSVPVGGPFDVTYRFVVAPTAPTLGSALTVFVHILSESGELLWTDDHLPTPSTDQWKPGQVVEYTRTLFVPRLAYTGEARLEVGLYSPGNGERQPLTGETSGMRAYRVATFAITPQSENLFVVFKDGWHNPEVADAGATEWQWSRGQATLSFRNPGRESTLLLQVDQPVAVSTDPQHVEVRVGQELADSFDLPSGRRELRRIPLTTTLLGEAQAVEVTLSVDKTFVPALVPALGSSDARELGVRVLRAYVEPK